MSPKELVRVPGCVDAPELTEAIPAAIVELDAALYASHRTTGSTHINGNVVVCVLEDLPTKGDVIDGRLATRSRNGV